MERGGSDSGSSSSGESGDGHNHGGNIVYRVRCWTILITLAAFLCEFLVLATAPYSPFRFIWGTWCLVFSLWGLALVIVEYVRRCAVGGTWLRPLLIETMKLVFSLLHVSTTLMDLLRMARGLAIRERREAWERPSLTHHLCISHAGIIRARVSRLLVFD